MKNYYTISRVTIGILGVIITLISLINEDISMKFGVTIFVFIITLAASFLTTPISRKMLKIGDSIANKYIKVLFYFAVLPLTLFVAYILYMFDLFVFEKTSGSMNLALITVFIYISTTIMVVVPYVQALIVLICRKIFKDK